MRNNPFIKAFMTYTVEMGKGLGRESCHALRGQVAVRFAIGC